MDQIISELEPKTLDAWSRSLKFEFRLQSADVKPGKVVELFSKEQICLTWSVVFNIVFQNFFVCGLCENAYRSGIRMLPGGSICIKFIE